MSDDPTAEKAAFRKPAASLPEQLAQDLRQRILAGDWRVGEAIPAETALAAHYAVSRNTLREATRQLIAQGHLRIQRGIGTIVTQPTPPARMNLGLFQSLKEAMSPQGRTPRIELHRLERRPGTLEETNRLQLPAGAGVLYAERAVYSDDELMSYGYDRYPDSLFPKQLDESLFSLSFVDIFKHLGVQVDSGQVEFHAVSSNMIGWGAESRKPQLYLLLDRLHFAASKPVFFANTYCVEGRNQISVAMSW